MSVTVRNWSERERERERMKRQKKMSEKAETTKKEIPCRKQGCQMIANTIETIKLVSLSI